MTKMLSCPFCGKTPKSAIARYYPDSAEFCHWEIKCCFVQVTDNTSEDESKHLVIEKWNTRSNE